MKKSLLWSAVLGFGFFAGVAQPAAAANITALGSLNQANFRLFSEDLGSALSYKAVTPPAPLGLTGFDLGIEVSSTEMVNSGLWDTVTGGNGAVSSLVVPKLHVFKGLPLGIDVGAFYSSIPTTNISLYGGELRYAILEGGVATPAVGIRGAITKLNGVDQLSLDTKNLDVSISKGFLMLTPYAGVGSVWVTSTPMSGLNLTEEAFRQNKVFVGANVNLGLTNIALEYDKTGSAKTYSAKLGFRF